MSNEDVKVLDLFEMSLSHNAFSQNSYGCLNVHVMYMWLHICTYRTDGPELRKIRAFYETDGPGNGSPLLKF